MSATDLAAQAEKQLKLHEKAGRKLDAAKHQQSTTLQEKLAARLKKKEEAAKLERENNEKQQLIASGCVKKEPPIGNVTFCSLFIKNIADILEQLGENEALRFLEEIHDLTLKEFNSHSVYLAKEELGSYMVVSDTTEDVLNMSFKIHETFMEHKWSTPVSNLASCKTLVSTSDSKVFSGPRVQIGIYKGDSTLKKDRTYTGLSVLKVNSIAKFAQGGQTLLSSDSWNSIDATKLHPHNKTEPGVYKLDGFSSGCKLVEVLPISVKQRSKFFGSVCAHCNEVIKPKEQYLKALDCVWHMSHFRCFQCNADLGGTYVEHEGSPYCQSCYLSKQAPKCAGCHQPISAGYINALDGYWHTDCFCCKRCSKRPSSDVQIYEHGKAPYCADCYKIVSK